MEHQLVCGAINQNDGQTRPQGKIHSSTRHQLTTQKITNTFNLNSLNNMSMRNMGNMRNLRNRNRQRRRERLSALVALALVLCLSFLAPQASEALKLPSFLSWMTPATPTLQQQQQQQHGKQQVEQSAASQPIATVLSGAPLKSNWPLGGQPHETSEESEQQELQQPEAESMLASASTFETIKSQMLGDGRLSWSSQPAPQQQPLVANQESKTGRLRTPFQSMFMLPSKHAGQMFSSLPKSLLGRFLGQTTTTSTSTTTSATPIIQWQHQQVIGHQRPYEHQFSGYPLPIASRPSQAAFAHQHQQQVMQHQMPQQQQQQHHQQQLPPKEHALGFGENQDFILMEAQPEQHEPVEPENGAANQQAAENFHSVQLASNVEHQQQHLDQAVNQTAPPAAPSGTSSPFEFSAQKDAAKILEDNPPPSDANNNGTSRSVNPSSASSANAILAPAPAQVSGELPADASKETPSASGEVQVQSSNATLPVSEQQVFQLSTGSGESRPINQTSGAEAPSGDLAKSEEQARDKHQEELLHPLENPESGRLESSAAATIVAANQAADDSLAPVNAKMMASNQQAAAPNQQLNGEQQQVGQHHQLSGQLHHQQQQQAATNGADSGNQFENFYLGPYNGLAGGADESQLAALALAASQADAQFMVAPAQQVSQQMQSPLRTQFHTTRQQHQKLASLSPVGMASSLLQQARNLIQLPFTGQLVGHSFRGHQHQNGDNEPLIEQQSSFVPFNRAPTMMSAMMTQQSQQLARPQQSIANQIGQYRMPRPFLRLHQTQQQLPVAGWPHGNSAGHSHSQGASNLKPIHASGPQPQQLQPQPQPQQQPQQQQRQNDRYFLMQQAPVRRPTMMNQLSYFMDSQPIGQQQTQTQTQTQQVAGGHPLNAVAAAAAMQAQQQASGYSLVVDHGNTNPPRQPQQQQQLQQPPPQPQVAATLRQVNGLKQQQQQQQRLPEQSGNRASKFKSGFYQIDAPKLIDQNVAFGQADQQQQQSNQDSDDDADDNDQQQQVAASSGDVNDDADDGEQDNDQQATESPNETSLRLPSQQPQLARQVGASIGVGQFSNLTSSPRRQPTKGQVFNEPISSVSASEHQATLAPERQPESLGQNFTQTRTLKSTHDVTLYDIEIPQRDQNTRELASQFLGQSPNVSYLDTQVYTLPYTLQMQPNGNAQFTGPHQQVHFPAAGMQHQFAGPMHQQFRMPTHPNYHHQQQPSNQLGRFALPFNAPPAPTVARQPNYQPFRQHQQQQHNQRPQGFQSFMAPGNQHELYNAQPAPSFSGLDWTSAPMANMPALALQTIDQEQEVNQFVPQQRPQPNRYFHYQPVAQIGTLASPSSPAPLAPIGRPAEVASQQQQAPQQQQFLLAIQHEPGNQNPSNSVFTSNFMANTVNQQQQQQQPAQQSNQEQQVVATTESLQQRSSTASSSQLANNVATDLLADSITVSPEPLVLVAADKQPEFSSNVNNNEVEPQAGESHNDRQPGPNSGDELASDLRQQPQFRSQQQQQQQGQDQLANGLRSPSAFCADRTPGLYADVSQRCKAYYQCAPTGHQMFRCNNQTQFNQKTQNCDWWYNVDCGGKLGSQSDFAEESTAGSSLSSTTTTSNFSNFSPTEVSNQLSTGTGEQAADADNRWSQQNGAFALAQTAQQPQGQESQGQQQTTLSNFEREQQQASPLTEASVGSSTPQDFSERMSSPASQGSESSQFFALPAATTSSSSAITTTTTTQPPTTTTTSSPLGSSGSQLGVERSAGVTDGEILSALAVSTQQSNELSSASDQSAPRVGATDEPSGGFTSNSPSSSSNANLETSSQMISNEQQQQEAGRDLEETRPAGSAPRDESQGQVKGARRVIQSEFGLGVQQHQQPKVSARSTRFDSTRTQGHLNKQLSSSNLDSLIDGIEFSNHRYASNEQGNNNGGPIYSTSANQGSVSYVPSTSSAPIDVHFVAVTSPSSSSSRQQQQQQSLSSSRLDRRFGARLGGASSSLSSSSTSTTTKRSTDPVASITTTAATPTEQPTTRTASPTTAAAAAATTTSASMTTFRSTRTQLR